MSILLEKDDLNVVSDTCSLGQEFNETNKIYIEKYADKTENTSSEMPPDNFIIMTDRSETSENNLMLVETNASPSASSRDSVIFKIYDKALESKVVRVNGELLQVEDGSYAFIQHSNKGENNIYMPIQINNGTVAYVIPDSIIDGMDDKKTPIDSTSKREKNKGFVCSYVNCTKSYASLHHLKVHTRAHTGVRPFKCPNSDCNKAFSTGFGLKTHIRTHNGERPYICNHVNCDKSFKTSGDLHKHIRIHTGERPFVCPVPDCGRSFTTCNICKVHVRTHTGERPYACTYEGCNKTFASVTNQRNHLRIHSGEKPYICSAPACGRRFTEYSSLYKHNQIHRTRHECDHCSQHFRSLQLLTTHLKVDHDESVMENFKEKPIFEVDVISVLQLDSAFPLRRPYDLAALLEQERRVPLISELEQRLLRLKTTLDEQWASIEEETDFENRLYATDSNCLFAGAPLSQFDLIPNFFDKILPGRPKIASHLVGELPPDCTKFHKLDFSMLTFPHLKSMRFPQSLSGEIESDAPLEIDVGAMLQANSSDWTAYNLALHYWQLRSNATNAIECARRAVYFAPRQYRYLPLLNLGTLLHSCQNLGEAAIVLHAAVDLDRNQFTSHVSLGHIYSLLGDYDRAAGCYANALTVRPGATLLAKQRAAVLCHQQLVSGLWALDAALKKIVDELHAYGELQQERLRAQARIAEERAYGIPFQTLPDNINSLWEALDRQVYMLTERMTRVDPLTRRQKIRGDSSSHHKMYKAKHSKSKQTTQNHAEDSCPETARAAQPEVDRELMEKAKKFQEFMAEEGSTIPLKKTIEKLVALQGNYEGFQPADSPYWKTVRRCMLRVETDSSLGEECGEKIISEGVKLSDEEGNQDDDLLDESGIENYNEYHTEHKDSCES